MKNKKETSTSKEVTIIRELVQNNPLYKAGLKAIALLKQKGFEGYFVGGCVRDLLLGRKANDIDITTDATVQQMQEVFAGFPTIPTGLAHGTLTVVFEKIPLEITTYRIDGAYEDYRHPKEVTFTDDIVKDLSRRDFTIGAVAYDGEQTLLDPFRGMVDIKERQIRAVGDPQKRFQEDPLRLLRALRFSCQLGFSIEEKTREAIYKMGHLIVHIAKERVTAECKQILVSSKGGEVLREFAALFSLSFFGVTQKQGVFLGNKLPPLCVEKEDMAIPLACLFINEQNIGEILKRMRYPKQTVCRTVILAAQMKRRLPQNKKEFKQKMSVLGRGDTELYLRSLAYIHWGDKEKQIQVKGLWQWLEEVVRNRECYSLHQLVISGKDLLDTGYSPSKELGRILDLLLQAVIEEKVENTREALLRYVKNMH